MYSAEFWDESSTLSKPQGKALSSPFFHPDKALLLEEINMYKCLLAKKLTERSEDLEQRGERWGCLGPSHRPLLPVRTQGCSGVSHTFPRSPYSYLPCAGPTHTLTTLSSSCLLRAQFTQLLYYLALPISLQ